MSKISVTIATLQSHNHIVDDIERGVKIYEQSGIEFIEQEPNLYIARVPHKKEFKTASVSFTRDGLDLKHHYCDCIRRYGNNPLCRHVTALVLAVQGGIAKSGIYLGKSATVKTTVNETNTAKTVGSGNLNVFATPMMIALMEKAACECLSDTLEPEQTSVGTLINISHTAASKIGTEITATAKIKSVFGRKIEFTVIASDGENEIGNGEHTRMIVDKKRFMSKLK